MRLFVLRHEKRQPHDPTFWSSLTPEGVRDAMYHVAPLLQSDIRPTHLYTSPLLRCLQTVAPYCAVNRNTHVLRCEPALYERVRDAPDPLTPSERTFDPSSFREQHLGLRPAYDYLHPYVDTSYTPHVPMDDIRWGETEHDVRERVVRFLSHLRSVHAPTDRVLLVTHRSVVNVLLERSDSADFPMGGIALVQETAHTGMSSTSSDGYDSADYEEEKEEVRTSLS